MTRGRTIVLRADDLENAVKRTALAAEALATAGSQLHTAIPADAFGVLGRGVAEAGNSAGEELARTFTLLGELSSATSQGIRVAYEELERV